MLNKRVCGYYGNNDHIGGDHVGLSPNHSAQEQIRQSSIFKALLQRLNKKIPSSFFNYQFNKSNYIFF